MMDLLKDLNEEQIKMVVATDGPVLVLAGAGSGKSKALTHRIAYLIYEKKVSPENILAITFTNKAASEMKSRIDNLIKSSDIKTTSSVKMGTFHSICAQILRREAHHLGYPQGFVIFDEDDAKKVIKQVLAKLNLSDKKIPPSMAKNLISGAKNELIGPAEYSDYADSFREKSIVDVYKLYQKELEKNEAMDFDDLLMNVVIIFQKYPEVLKKYQTLWKYLLIDEYQDTNHVQYLFAKLLAKEHRNICVVGDDWQCFSGETKVKTDEGYKKICDIKKGDRVTAASGYGTSHAFAVTQNHKFDYAGKLVEIRMKNGSRLKLTPNHILFSRIKMGEGYAVYLMYSREKGYRIGVAKNTRFDGRKEAIGLRVRANQERADRMWILKICNEKKEAVYLEQLYSYKYGIPMLVFRSYSNRCMTLDQKQIDSIYHEVDTVERAKEVFNDFGLSFEYPHYWPQAITKGDRKRININLVLFGDTRQTARSPWSASRISVSTSGELPKSLQGLLGIRAKRGKKNSFRGEIHNLDWGVLEDIVQEAGSIESNLNIIRYSNLTQNKFLFTPASSVLPGMVLPIMGQNGEIIEEEVVSVGSIKYTGFVYDLDVEKVHNYIADEVVVHNSIYSWRGANFQNILDFEKDYKETQVFRLEKNYRSTKAIINAAQSVIERNTERSTKKLYTDNDEGKPIDIYEAGSEEDEAGFVVRTAERLKSEGYKMSEMAIFYRTNAQSRAIEEELLRARTPYKIVGGVRFYERKEIKDALAWLRVASGANDWIAFERSLLSPPSGIGKISVVRLREMAENNNLKITGLMNVDLGSEVGNRVVQPLTDYFRKLNKIKEAAKKSLSEAVELAIKTSGLIEHLDDGTFENEERIENLKELLSVVKELEAVKNDLTLENFLEEVALISDLDNYSEDDDGITLMTLHTSKGLEYKVVFIVGLEENIFPHSRSMMEPAEMEEERRLFYVGMTRAKELLYLIHARRRLYFGGIQQNQPSRFLAELPNELINFVNTQSNQNKIQETVSQVTNNFNVGDEVEHEFFGKGKVLEVVDDEITADFNVYGKKTVSVEYAPLRKL